MYCSQCGKTHSDKARFCIKCGHDLTEDAGIAGSEVPTLPIVTEEASTAGAEVPNYPMKIIWPVVLVITLIFGYTLTPVDALAQLLENQLGVGDEGVQMITFAAGYTLPAVVASLIGTLLFLRTNLEFKTSYGYIIVMGIGLLFVASAFACDRLGLGIPVRVGSDVLSGGPPVSLVVRVARVYINSYGWGLFVTAVAVGIASGLQISNWLNWLKKL